MARVTDPSDAPNARGRLAAYGATVFLAAGLTMVLEIAAGRLVAPYVGSSLYTWTAIIGVVLAGLSAGNWLGGRWADRGAGPVAAGLALGAAAVASLAILLLLELVGPFIRASSLGPLGATLVLVGGLFLLPAILLGILTPLLTTLALGLDGRTGHVVGRMHALAALGSIAGTFIAGYWLIPAVGVHGVILATALVLAAMAAPFLVAAWRRGAALAGLLLLLSGLAWQQQALVSPCDEESAYFCIRVEDATRDVPFGEARALVLDHLLHSINHRQEPALLASPYLHLMDEVARQWPGMEPASADWFFAGGGAYTHPRALEALDPGASVTVAEVDPAVTRVAEEALFVDTDGWRVLHRDARLALARLEDERFDVVVGDVFHDVAVPAHLVTREFAELVRERLRPGGLYTLNIVDRHPQPRLVASLLRTLEGVFEHVDVWHQGLPGGDEPARVTYVLTASDTAPPASPLRSRHGLSRQWERVTARVERAVADPMVLTDAHAPVERLLAPLLLKGG
ncbi:MAG: fused MFS/spermidine synthase [Pseudomonadota bacterium]